MARLSGPGRSLNAAPGRLGAAPDARRRADQWRGSARQRGYTARWDEASAAFKAANPLCLGCLAMGWAVATEVTDHVRPHRGERSLFWDTANWQPACSWHHNVVKQRLEAMFDTGEIAADGLRLDSEAATRLTVALAPGGASDR